MKIETQKVKEAVKAFKQSGKVDKLGIREFEGKTYITDGKDNFLISDEILGLGMPVVSDKILDVIKTGCHSFEVSIGDFTLIFKTENLSIVERIGMLNNDGTDSKFFICDDDDAETIDIDWRAFKALKNSIAKNDRRFSFNYLHIDKDGQFVGTDGRALVYYENGHKLENDYLVKMSAIQSIIDRKAKTIKFCKKEKDIVQVDNNFFVNEVDAKFPNWRRVVPKSGEQKSILDKKALVAVLKLAQKSIATKRRKEEKPVDLSFKDGQLVLSHTAQQGSEQTAHFESSIDAIGETESNYFNADLLLDTLADLPVEKLEYWSGVKVGTFLAGNYCAVIMGMGR